MPPPRPPRGTAARAARRSAAKKIERLLGRHQDPAEVLVLRGRDAPQPLGQALVVAVERRREREREAEERRAARTPRRRRRSARASAPSAGSSVRTGHQKSSPIAIMNSVLDVEQPRVAERDVVDAAEVDDVPADEPDRQRHRRPGRRTRTAGRPARAIAAAHRRRQPEDQERRRPVGDDHVLEQVEEDEVVDRDRLERRVEGARRSARRPARTRRVPAPGAAARGARRGRTPTRAPTPSTTNSGSNVNDQAERIRRGLARRPSASLGPLPLARRAAAARTRDRRSAICSTIITTPASFWSVSGERPSSRTGWST